MSEEPPPGTRDEEDPAVAEPPRRKRSVLLVVATLLVSLVVVGGAVGFVVYDQATEIDRSTPAVAVRQFLQAGLVDRDVDRVAMFVCRQWSPSDALAAIASGANDSVRVTFGVTSVEESGDSAKATVRITSTLSGHSDVATWRVTIVRQDGWRVCGVDRLGSLDP